MLHYDNHGAASVQEVWYWFTNARKGDSGLRPQKISEEDAFARVGWQRCCLRVLQEARFRGDLGTEGILY
jgi:hypothetical protein